MRLSIAQRFFAIACLLSLLLGAGSLLILREFEANKAYMNASKAHNSIVVATVAITHHLHNYVKLRTHLEAQTTVLSDGTVANPVLPETPQALRDKITENLSIIKTQAASLPAPAQQAFAPIIATLEAWVNAPDRVQESALHTLESEVLHLPSMPAPNKDHLQWFALAMLALGILAPFILLLYTRSNITRPLAQLQTRLYELTNNDYDGEVPCIHRTDELGNIAFSINVLRVAHQHIHTLEAEHLARAENEVQQKKLIVQMINDFRTRTMQVIDALGQSSGQLSSVSEKILSSVDSAQRHARTIDETIGKTSVDVCNASTHADSAYEAVSEISKASDRSSKLSADMEYEVNAALQTVSELSDATGRITGVTHLIRKITERINLLALNAGIESARAGEAGKGFVVVAQEVKILAAQTKKATEEIIDNILLLQEKSIATSQALGTVKSRVTLIRENGEQSQDIINSQHRVVNDLSFSMKNATSAMGTIQKSVHTVAKSVDSVQSISRKVAETASGLNTSANILSQEVRKFLNEIGKTE